MNDQGKNSEAFQSGQKKRKEKQINRDPEIQRL